MHGIEHMPAADYYTVLTLITNKHITEILINTCNNIQKYIFFFFCV